MVFRNKEKQALLEELLYLCECVLGAGGFTNCDGRKCCKRKQVTQKYSTRYEIRGLCTEIELSLHAYGNSLTKSHALELSFHPSRFEYNIHISSAYVVNLKWEESSAWVSFANTKELERILSDWINSIRSPLQVKLYLDILQNQLRGVYYGV